MPTLTNPTVIFVLICMAHHQVYVMTADDSNISSGSETRADPFLHLPIYYRLLMQSLRSLYTTLSSITNLSSTFEKRIDGKVCVRKSTTIDKLLVANLKHRLMVENIQLCDASESINPSIQPPTTAPSTQNPTSKTMNVPTHAPLNNSTSATSTVSSTSITSTTLPPTISVDNNGLKPTTTDSTNRSTNSTNNILPRSTTTPFNTRPSFLGNTESNFTNKRKRRSAERAMTADEEAILKSLNVGVIPGAKAWKKNCIKKRDITSVDTRNMCETCQYTIQLPANFYPRYHRHLTCGTPTDNKCFSNQGICSKTVQNTHVLILHPISPVIVDEMVLQLTTCCTCEIVAGNLFDVFV